jgi:hypothetical protein
VSDPFDGLDISWAAAAEQRAVRAERLRRFRGVFRRRRLRLGPVLLVVGLAALPVLLMFGDALLP